MSSVPNRPCDYCGKPVEHKLDPRSKRSYCDRKCSADAQSILFSKGDKREACNFDKRRGVWRVRRIVNGKWREVHGSTREQALGRAALLDSGVPLNRGASRPSIRGISPASVRYALSFLDPWDHINKDERLPQGIAILWKLVKYAEAGLAPVGTPAESVQPPPPRRRAAWLDALPKRVEDAS